MPAFDLSRIQLLQERLAGGKSSTESSIISDLAMLADLYLQADSYLPALETIERLLMLPESRTLSAERRTALESKVVACRIAKGDCQAALAHARELLRTAVASEAPAVASRLHALCTEALFRMGRIEACGREAEKALELAEKAGDLGLAAGALNLVGRVAYRAGDMATARDAYEQALALYRRVGDEASTAHLRNNLGLIHKNLCQWEAAVEHLREALEIHRRMGRFAETANPLMNLGIVFQKSGDWVRASECYHEAQRIYLQVADQMRLAVVAIGLGNIARLERRFDEAEALLQDALDHAGALSAHREEVLATEFLGELDFDRGRFDDALAHYDAAAALTGSSGTEADLVVEIERRRAEALCALGRLDEAETACETAQRLAERIRDRLEHAVTHRVWGEIAAARGLRHDAVEAYRRAATQLSECHERLESGKALLLLGRATSDRAEARQAVYRAGALFAELSIPYWLEQSERELQRLFGPVEVTVPERPGSLLGRRHRAPSLVACSPAMKRVESLAQRGAGTDLSVLITGETGTGKELVARTIHGLSTRLDKPFLALNCGALRADLALSQLFGHRKGAFTGAHADGMGLVEAAHGGTLFLDEVGELPADVQVTLLRFLESGEYLRLGETQARRSDARVIAATNRELRDAEGESRFRRDLLFRLNEIEIRVPPLRERRDDVVPLARHFLAFYGGIDGPRLAEDAEAILLSYVWPGNVRELENVMKRVAALHAGESDVSSTELLPFLTHPAPSRSSSDGDRDGRAEILTACAEAAGNKSRAAEILGISRKTLYARLKRLGIDL